MPLYHLFYHDHNYYPCFQVVLAQTEEEEKHFLAEFPKDYQISDVVRLFATTNTEKELPVFVAWINGNSIFVRFSNDDDKVVLANMVANIGTNATQLDNTAIVTLDAYMSKTTDLGNA